MLEAARVASKTSDGAHLWQQVQTALDDSMKTIQRINAVLDRISKTTGIMKRLRTQLQESLKEGELGRLRDRVKMFNATISLPIQMVCVMLQLEQRGMSSEHQRQLDLRFVHLERMMGELIVRLSVPGKVAGMSGSAEIVGNVEGQGNVDGNARESYLTFAKKMLQTASAAASVRSMASSVGPQMEEQAVVELGGNAPPAYHQLAERRRTMTDWIPSPDTGGEFMELPGSGMRAPSIAAQPSAKMYEINYKLAQNHLKLGQQRAQEGNHESAEKSFKKALQLLEKHDFSGKMAFQPAEVVLMLAQSCLMQQKYDQAIALLNPVAEMETNIFPSSRVATTSALVSSQAPDRLQALAASHLLGEVYRQKGDFDEAKAHSLKAFMERTEELGESDEKTLESVQLVIDVYRAMGDEEEAEAYEVFLTPDAPKRDDNHKLARPATITDEQTAVQSISPAPSETALPQPSPQPHTAQPSRRSFASRIRNLGRPSQGSLAQISPLSDSQRHSFSRTTTLNEPEQTYLNSATWNSPSERSSFIDDDDSTAPSSAARLERSLSSRQLEPIFLAVQQACSSKEVDKAVKIALSFIESYESKAFIVRKDALEKNIRKGTSGSGLAASGKGYAAIHYFCELKEEHAEEVALLIRYGADVNAVAYKAGFTQSSTKGVLTPLQLAIEHGHITIAKMLLECKDINVEQKDGDGFQPLLMACRKKQYAVVRALLDMGPKSLPSTFPSTWYGTSLLHDAAKHCDLTIVTMLCEKGLGEVNGQDKFLKTPLMHAIIKKDVASEAHRGRLCKERVAVVRRLLEYGADVNLVDVRGMTARGYAEKEEGQDVEELRSCVGEARFELSGE